MFSSISHTFILLYPVSKPLTTPTRCYYRAWDKKLTKKILLGSYVAQKFLKTHKNKTGQDEKLMWVKFSIFLMWI